jgi:hypothetical protein
MIAQIYTKTNGDYTSILVTNEKAEVYFRDVLEIPELTGVQRGVSFVKHQLDVEKTELYPDKLKAEEQLKDIYINWCMVNAVAGENRNLEADKRCTMELQTFLRWNTVGGRRLGDSR